MPRHCTVCTHPQRGPIERDVSGPESLVAVASRYAITPRSLQRHARNHMTDDDVAAKMAERSAAGEQVVGGPGAGSAYARLGLRQNGRQMQRFVDELLALPNRNASQAARNAGYSPRSATAQASALVRRPDVRAAIIERLMEVGPRRTHQEILEEMESRAFADIAEYGSYEEDGRLKLVPLAKLSPAARRRIRGWKTGSDGRVRDLVMHGNESLLRTLAAHAGIMTDRTTTVIRVVTTDPKTGQDVPFEVPPPTAQPEEPP